MAYPTEPKVRASGTTDTLKIPTLRSESEGAYTKVRRISTKTKSVFKLSYNNIREDEFEILREYFNDNQGISFTFVHPQTSETYTCIFGQDELVKTYKDGVLVSTSVTLEEV